MVINHIGFQNLMYRKFISPGDHDAKKTAGAIGVPLSTFYKYCEGESYCPVDLVARIYNATGDSDFLDFIINNTDQKLSPRETSKDKKPLEGELLDVAAANGSLMQAAHKALEEGRLDKKEAQILLRKIRKELMELDELKERILETLK